MGGALRWTLPRKGLEDVFVSSKAVGMADFRFIKSICILMSIVKRPN